LYPCSATSARFLTPPNHSWRSCARLPDTMATVLDSFAQRSASVLRTSSLGCTEKEVVLIRVWS